MSFWASFDGSYESGLMWYRLSSTHAARAASARARTRVIRGAREWQQLGAACTMRSCKPPRAAPDPRRPSASSRSRPSPSRCANRSTPRELTYSRCSAPASAARSRWRRPRRRGPPLTPLLAASKAGDANGVQAALQSGEQAASANDGDRGALHYAAAGGHDTVVRGLVQANADVNQPSIKANATPLVLAAKAAKASTVQVLLELGAQPGVKTRKGLTALDVAQAGAAQPATAAAMGHVIALLQQAAGGGGGVSAPAFGAAPAPAPAFGAASAPAAGAFRRLRRGGGAPAFGAASTPGIVLWRRVGGIVALAPRRRRGIRSVRRRRRRRPRSVRRRR